MVRFGKRTLLFLFISALAAIAFGQGDNSPVPEAADRPETESPTNLEKLANLLHNGRPTFAYFYYSVACSCTAVQCSMAAEAIALNGEIGADDGNFNYISIDAFYETAAESLYQCQIVPLIVGFNSKGEEVKRIDWDINKDAIDSILKQIKE